LRAGLDADNFEFAGYAGSGLRCRRCGLSQESEAEEKGEDKNELDMRHCAAPGDGMFAVSIGAGL